MHHSNTRKPSIRPALKQYPIVLIRGAYNATPGGWVIWRPLVGDIITLVEHWGSYSTAAVIAQRRNERLLGI
jgi:hypothetical protein